MTIWVVTRASAEWCDVVGVFSSEILAQLFINHQEKNYQLSACECEVDATTPYANPVK